MSKIEVNLEFQGNPSCPHGPTVLFTSINNNGTRRMFYACSACRDRKDCNFYVNADEISKFNDAKKAVWEQESKKFISGIDHRKQYITLNKVKQLNENERAYCRTCNVFALREHVPKHSDHDLLKNLTDHQLEYPTSFLNALDQAKKEAQFLFSTSAIKTTVSILQEQKFKNIICLGTPRIFEYISSQVPDMNCILLDIDKRFHNFFGPLNFCWYNSFNNHFFLPEAAEVFKDFLQNDKGKGFVLVTDPPFGGRTELLAHTFSTINKQYKELNKVHKDLPILWFFPYFMEPQIINSLPNFKMMDYKVDYDNHSLFQNGPKGRKHGSPVRIFTNIDLRTITLPEYEGYKYCKLCKRWVAEENMHCIECDDCTSKDGKIYQHCNLCKRCVKPTWKHCNACKRCALPEHSCDIIPFVQKCFQCQQDGHKKKDCPKLLVSSKFKRKTTVSNKSSKKKCK